MGAVLLREIMETRFHEIQNNFKCASKKMGYTFDYDIFIETYIKCDEKLNNNEEQDVKGKPFNFNASIYQFNWEYLLSIKILRPKIMLAGFVNYLTGGLLYEASTAEFNFTKQLIKSKISSSVKKIIEADDMEVEDCYMTFSNDEVNTMLEEMLLSRYNATRYSSPGITLQVCSLNGKNKSFSNPQSRNAPIFVTSFTFKTASSPIVIFGFAVVEIILSCESRYKNT